VEGLSSQLVRRGNQVTIITRGSPWHDEVLASETPQAVRVRFLPVYPLHVSVHVRLIERWLAQHRAEFDLVHCHSPLTLAPRGKWPILSTFHTPMNVDLRHIEVVDARSLAAVAMRPFSTSIEKRLIASSHLISSVSAQTKRELLEYGLEDENVEVFWNGVDTKRFVPNTTDTESRTILYVGRLSYRKGLPDLLKCARIVLEKHPEWCFKVIGKGPLASLLKREARASGIPGTNFVLGGFVNRDQLILEYQKASLFVLPSHYEGMPTSLLEAMSCGLPVIATSVGGVLDLIQDGKNGLISPPGNPRALAMKICQAIEDENLRRSLSRNARSFVVNHFEWSRLADRFVEIVRSHFPGVAE